MSERITNERLVEDYALFLAGKIVGGLLVKEDEQETARIEGQRQANRLSADRAEAFDTEQDQAQAIEYANRTADNVA